MSGKKLTEEAIKARVTADGNTYISHSRTADKHGHNRIIVRYTCKCGDPLELKSEWSKRIKFCYKCTIERKKAANIVKYGYEHHLQNPDILGKKKATMIERFGCEHPLQNADVMEKLKATNVERYGCESSLKNTEVRAKMNATNIEKYGCENPFGNAEIQEKIKETNLEKYGYEHVTQNAEIRERIKETNLEKFGFVSSLQHPEVIEKIKATMRERFGCEHPIQNQEIRERMKTTNMERYGCEHPMQNLEIRDKIKATMVERFGYEYAIQNPDVFAKAQAKSYLTHQFTFPSGRIVDYQGYERMAYEALLYAYDVPEDDIIVEDDIRSVLPRFKYTMNGTLHTYNPDIFIWSQQKIIEVKSTWTASINPEKLELKRQCVLDMGFKYEMWIMNPKTGEPTIVC